MNEAAGQKLMPSLVEQAGNHVPALMDRVEELLGEQPVVSAQPPDDSAWKGFSASGEERPIVEDDETLLDISFLELGLRKAAAGCRLSVKLKSGIQAATGWRIGPSLLLTNHHVLYDWQGDGSPALSVEAAFGYETDLEGKLRKANVVMGDVATIEGDRDHDFAVISTSEALPGDVPTLSLAPSASPAVDDRVIIIQHPHGLPKKIALAHNLVRYIDDDLVQYWTDTEAGSSGSPVFNESWEVVALHHRWVESPAPDDFAFRNQGRNIRRVAGLVDGLGVSVGHS
jgi:hypothetical protein